MHKMHSTSSSEFDYLIGWHRDKRKLHFVSTVIHCSVVFKESINKE